MTVAGPGLKLCPVGKETFFTLDPDSCDVSVVSPSGDEVSHSKGRDAGSGATKVTYVPTEVGPHMVKILDNGVPVEGSPFTCNAYDTGRITVASLPEVCAVGQPVTFTVDASKAGEGETFCHVI